MQRVCFNLQVKDGLTEDYLRDHQVWPEMQQAIRDVGITNFSMFVREDGLLVGYFEAEDPEKSLDLLGQTDVNRRWQALMAKYFESGGDMKGGGIRWLKQYFYIE